MKNKVKNQRFLLLCKICPVAKQKFGERVEYKSPNQGKNSDQNRILLMSV